MRHEPWHSSPAGLYPGFRTSGRFTLQPLVMPNALGFHSSDWTTTAWDFPLLALLDEKAPGVPAEILPGPPYAPKDRFGPGYPVTGLQPGFGGMRPLWPETGSSPDKG